MMMGNRRHPGFRQKFCQSNPQRHMHGNSQTILWHHDINAKLLHKPVKCALQIIGQLTNPLSNKAFSLLRPPNPVIDPFIL